MTTATAAATAATAATTPTWGTAKTHGLKDGDQFLYFGRNRKAPASEGVLRTYHGGPLNSFGGAATRVWVAPAPAVEAPAPKAKAPKAKAAPKAEAPAKVGRPAKVKVAATLPAGYSIKWPHASYDLAKADKGTDGPAWLVICNAHGTTTEAANAKEGDTLGRKADRATWCEACAKA